MIFWSKNPETKLEKLKARQKRDLKSLIHMQHMEAAEAAREEGQDSMGFTEVDPNEGIDQDTKGKLGAMKQEIVQGHHERARNFMKMRGSIGRARKKARARGKSLGM